MTLNDRFLVLDRNGKDLWHWDFRAGNRFLTATSVAIAPNCDWVAFVGDSSYRYAWIVRRRGAPTSIPFKATPLSAAISHGGDRLAIGDGANTLRLFSSEGKPLWNKLLEDVPIIDRVAFAQTDQAVMATAWSGAVLSMDGELRWSRNLLAEGMRTSRNLESFVTWSLAWHFSITPAVSFLDKEGQVVWTRLGAGSSPYAAISPSGDMVVAELLDDQSLDPLLINAQNPPSSSLTLLSASGAVLHTFREPGAPIAFSADGRRLLLERPDRLEAVDLDENVKWRVDASRRSGLTQLEVSPDLDVIVIGREGRIEWYAPPR